jgi:hypothetical protein
MPTNLRRRNVVLESQRSLTSTQRWIPNVIGNERPGASQARRPSLFNRIIWPILGNAVELVVGPVLLEGQVHTCARQVLLRRAERHKVGGVALHDVPAVANKVAGPGHEVLSLGGVPDGVRCPGHASIGRGDDAEVRGGPGFEVSRGPDDDSFGAGLGVVVSTTVYFQILEGSAVSERK